MKKSAILLLLLVACNTYDLPVIYRKNFQPGKNDKLLFSGFYSDTLGPKLREGLNDAFGKPVFFYGDGSAYAGEQNMSRAAVEPMAKNNSLNGSWGNYKVNGDTIWFERFHLIGSNYRRVILKGVVAEKQVHWVSRKDHTEDYKPVDYTIFFSSASAKPDSTMNWTRKKEKYNR